MSDDFSNNQTAKYFPSLANQDYEPAENLSSGDDESKSDDEVAADFKRREAEMLGTEMMDLGAGHFGRPLLEPKIRNYPHPEIQSDDEMELSDGGRSDDDFPSTSKYVEDFSEEFKDVDDFPQNLLTRFYARTNAEHWPISVDPEDDFARLLDCAYYLVVKNVDENAKMLDFLKLAHICFEKLLLGNISRTFTEIQHRNCWLLCAQFLKLFATKLKMAVTSNDANICPLYFAIAFNIFNDNSVFNVLNAKFSAQYMPCHVDDIELMPRYTIYSHDNLFNNEYQQYRMLFYVFAKYDGFDNLKRFIEEVMVYSLNGPQFLLLKVVADFLCAITSFMSEAFSSMTCYLINKSIYLLERATDEEWNYKAIGDFRDSMLLQHLMTLKNLATIVFNKRLMDREDLIRVDNMQLKALLKTIQFAKLAGRTAAIEELQKLLMNVSQPNPSMLMDPTINITRTFEDLIIWIRENDVCGILLRDNLHLLAYIERIERVFDILLKKGKIRTQDLEQMWAASWGKHDVVQRNMIMMISRLAKHLSKELIQRLFELVKASFRKTSAVREKALLLDFIKHLVSSQIYYNNSEIVYRKAFDLTWELYQDPNLSLETIQSLLTTQLLSINNSDKLREECFQKCLTKIKQDCEMVVPLFLHIWHCACETNEKKKRYCTSRLIFNIIVKENIINVFIESLCRYLDKVSKQLKDSGVTMPIDNPDVILIGNNFTHRSQITYRIEGLSHFIVECSERDYYPECSDIENLWKAIIENPVSDFERQIGFNFFGTNLPKFDSQTNMELFQSCLMNFPPKYFNVSSFNEICLMLKRSAAENLMNSDYAGYYSQLMDPNLFNDYIVKARNYVWKCILEGTESVSFRAIEFATCEMDNMADITRRNASAQQFVDECYRKLNEFNRDLTSATKEELKEVLVVKIQRVIKALKILLIRYENCFKNRWHSPLYRATMGRCYNLMFVIIKDDRGSDHKRFLPVNSNFTLKQLYQQVYRIVAIDRKLRSHEKMDLLNYRIPPGFTFAEAYARLAQLVNAMKNDKIAPVNTNLQDVLRYCGKESMKRTLGELHIDENTITTVRFTRSRRDTTTFTFVSSMTRGDTPESSTDEISDDDDNLATDDDFEMKPIILSQNQERIFFLMNLADMAHKQKYEGLRDEIVSLLDRLTVTDKLRGELEKAMYTNQLMDHVVFDSPTRTCFYFQIIHAFLTPVRFNENFYQFEVMFLSKNCIEQFFKFFTQNIIDGKGYFAALNARILLSFARMVKYVSMANLKLMQHNRSDGSVDSNDMILDDDSYFSSFVTEVLGMEQVHRATMAQYSENYLVPLNVLKILLFSSWTATRCSIPMITCRSAPMANNESSEDENMELDSVLSDSDSTISSFAEDLVFMKINDKSESLCETLAVEALDAFLVAAKYCPDVCSLFHTPKHLLIGGTIVNEETSNNPSFYEYAVDGMLFANSDVLRHKIARSFFVMLQNFPETHGEDGPRANAMLDVLFANLPIAENRFLRSQRYFECLYQLLNVCQKEGIVLNDAEEKFNQIRTWFEKTKIAIHEMGSTYQREELLVPYLKLAMHFLRLSPRSFVEEVGESGFVAELFDDYLMPFTKALASLEIEDDTFLVNTGASPATSENSLLIHKPNKVLPICRSDAAVSACFQLILELVRECPRNMDRSLSILFRYFYQDAEPFANLEPPPAFFPRDPTVFVGLKNAGATCYMNSVLQQLFMIEPFRQMIMDAPVEKFRNIGNGIDPDRKQRLNYAKDLIHAVQSVFANLLASDEQFHVPIEFWDTFQFGGRDVNTREQQDALEFFISLADALDESFKAMGGTAPFEKFFGGTFADQKKCKDCPHTFTTEQLFTSIAVDIRSHNNLLLSLNEYVTGDLLEGDNAYFCEICKEKVTAVKRMCIQKLPPYLVFQLKRFDMDWNRGSPIKFFDYFNFPMTLDMEPFTTTGVEKRENSPRSNSINCDSEQTSTMYRLRGVVVHSGEANGGHYYSFIADTKEDGKQQWYRFDDTEVTAWDHNDVEAKINWFGGYNDSCLPNEKDKKRFSAYMLVYESIPVESSNLQQISSSTNRSISVHSPSPIPSPNVNSVDVRFGSMSLHSKRSIANRLPYYWERIVTKNNLKFAQERFQFSPAYYRFLRDLLRIAALQTGSAGNSDKFIFTKRALHVFSTFLYTTGIRNPFEIRRCMNDWIQTFEIFIKIHPEVLTWFMDSFLCKRNVIYQTLLAPLVAVNDLRLLLETMIKSPVFHCLNWLENDNFGSINRTHIDNLVDSVITKIVQTSKTLNAEFWNNSHNVLRLLIAISNHSVLGARRLIAQNLMYPVVTMVGQTDDKMRPLRDSELMFELLASMLTSCTGIVKSKKNPYARKSLAPYYMTDNISTWFQNNNNLAKLFSSMLFNGTEVHVCISLANYLCWNNLIASTKLLSAFNYRATEPTVQTMLKILKAIIEIKDDCQLERIKIALLGHESTKTKGMLTESAAFQSHYINRLILLAFDFVTLWENEPMVKKAILGHSLLENSIKTIKTNILRGSGTVTTRQMHNQFATMVPRIVDILTQVLEENEQFLAAESSTTNSSVSQSSQDKSSECTSEVSRTSTAPPSYEAATSSNSKESNSTNSIQENHDFGLSTSPITFRCSSRRDFCDSSNHPENNDDSIGMTDDDEFEADDENDDDEELQAMQEILGCSDPQALANVPSFFNDGPSTPKKVMNTLQKAGKKRHFHPPTSSHGSNSSLPSYDGMPTSRKVRHAQSPNTSPVKIPFNPPPSYDECVRNDSVSPMQVNDEEPASSANYTGHYSSDGPPSV